MTTERAWLITIVAVLAFSTSEVDVRGQTVHGQPSYFYPPRPLSWHPSAAGSAALPPMMYQPGMTYQPGWSQVAPAGFSQVVPANYLQPEPQPETPEPPDPLEADTLEELLDQQADAEYYSYGGYHGGRLAGGLLRILGLLAPYSEGGCCAPHWFDVHAEAVFLERDQVSENVPFSSLGFPSPPTDPPNIVLDSDDLELGTEPGLRVTGTFQTGPGSNVEVTYLGMTHWSAGASVTDTTTRLWSPFSEFGTNPRGVPFFGYVEVDRADFHELTFKTSMNTIEANYRRRWVGPTCLFQGSYLLGFRYFQLRDNLKYNTLAPLNSSPPNTPPAPFMNYEVTAVNHLYGAQAGGDLWMCLLPGLNVGGELKAGLFGNDARQQTSIVATSIPLGQFEEAHSSQASFVGEVDLMATYQVSPKFTIRGGYMLLYSEGVALGTEIFNPAPPTALGVPVGATPAERLVTVDTSGNAVWYGWTFGVEYMW